MIRRYGNASVQVEQIVRAYMHVSAERLSVRSLAVEQFPLLAETFSPLTVSSGVDAEIFTVIGRAHR